MIKSEVMPLQEVSDADLVAESLSGDREAFGEIVERYQTLIASLAYCATGDVSRSEDLAQETFVTAWDQLAELREPAKLRSWLCSITRFLISKALRRQDHEPLHQAQSLEALDERSSPEPLPVDQAISQEELSLLWRSLERVPPIYREPLVLFYREHQSIELVAQGLGLSEDAVKQRLSRGRKFLQEQFLAFVAGALDQTRPGKTFALGVLAALPLLGATAKGAAVGTVGAALAKHGSVAAKATSSGGSVQAIYNVLIGMAYWVAGALSFGGYVGYKMGGDSQSCERARRSVAAFWRIMGISMFSFFCLPLLVALFCEQVMAFHLSRVSASAIGAAYLNVALPLFMFGVVPLSLVVWIWQRRRPLGPDQANSRPISSQSPKSFTIWVSLAMTMALAYLGFICWSYSRFSRMHILVKDLPAPRYLSTSEVQQLIANPQGRDLHLSLTQRTSGARTLYGDLDEHGTRYSFVAPAENSTMALLAEKGVSYETRIEGRDFPIGSTRLEWQAQRLLEPFCCFLLVAGAATLLRGHHRRQFGMPPITDSRNERRVDRAFAALVACGMLAIAVGVGLTTDWNLHRITASQVAKVVAQHPNARFEVFEYYDGSRKLWISDHQTPDFIATATEATLGLLERQGITCQAYVLSARNYPGRSQSSAVLWVLALTAVSGVILWWAVAHRASSPSRS